MNVNLANDMLESSIDLQQFNRNNSCSSFCNFKFIWFVCLSKLLENANIDEATHAYNKSFLIRFLQNAMQTNQQVSLCFLDVDDFKQINDKFGHLAGDQILSDLCSYIMTNAKADKLKLFRFGGDEFVITDTSNDFIAFSYCIKEIIEGLHSITFLNDVKIKISYGVSHYEQLKNYADLLKSADDKMREMKRMRKNNI